MCLQDIFNVLDRHKFGSKYLQNLNYGILCLFCNVQISSARM